MFKEIYKTVIRKINIFLERPYTDSNGKYHTNGNLQAIIEREIGLEHPKSASEIVLVSASPRLIEKMKKIAQYQRAKLEDIS